MELTDDYYSELQWKDFSFQVEVTGDGSPSLRLFESECMHHSGGALEETEMIYTSLLKHCLGLGWSAEFLVVGLGLGYIELIVARECQAIGIFDFKLTSFESVPELRNCFIRWLKGQPLSEEIRSTYDDIYQRIRGDGADFKNTLRDAFDQGRFEIRKELKNGSYEDLRVSGIFFDAFSSKTTPELWTEEFLCDFFNTASNRKCAVSTYASKGTLKRALMFAEFTVETKEGFKGKRNSTFATRQIS